jgi:hypothetical protein
MKRSLTHLAALLLALVVNPLQAADDSPAATLGAADDERVSAIVAADPARLTAIFSDELRYAHSTGAVDDKASYMDSLVSGRTKYVVYDYEERKFTFPVPGIALMAGRVHIQSTNAAGAVSDAVLSVLAVWREEQGKWRFLAWQSCRLPLPTPK